MENTTENNEFKEMKSSLIKVLVIIILMVTIIVNLVPKPKGETCDKHKTEASPVKI